MQKVVNVLAVASSVVSLAVVGSGLYVFVNKDAIIKSVTDGAMESVLGGGSLVGGNYALDQATGGPDKRIKAEKTELQLIIREEVRSAIKELMPTSTGDVVREENPGDYKTQVPQK